MKENKKKVLLICITLICLGAIVIALFFGDRLLAIVRTRPRTENVWAFIRKPEDHQDWIIEPLTQCGDAPFVFPTRGFVGFLHADSFTPLKWHTGLDIFSGGEVGKTPVYAPYDAYLTREDDWKSSVILRIPEDPMQKDRQIWVYMTHMADKDGNSFIDAAYPPGTKEVFIHQGDLIGYQGNYSGNPVAPTGLHLHISIVRDDGTGHYTNETQIENVYDPSPYFGFQLSAKSITKNVPACAEDNSD
jgi:hypothetical protein